MAPQVSHGAARRAGSYAQIRPLPSVIASAAAPISQGEVLGGREGTVASGANPVVVSGDQAQAVGAGHTVHMPAVRHLLRNAAAHLMEATIAPLALFYGVFAGVGMRWAVIASLLWAYAAIGRRLITGQRIPGILLLAAGLFTVRTVLALATGSVFVYFLQPTLGTFLVAGMFLTSTRFGRPLAERLADDFCPLPESLMGNGRVKQFFLRISLLWAVVYVVNGVMTLMLLLTSSLGTFLVLRTATSTALTVCAIGTSFLWFRSSLRDEGVVLRWATARS